MHCSEAEEVVGSVDIAADIQLFVRWNQQVSQLFCHRRANMLERLRCQHFFRTEVACRLGQLYDGSGRHATI